MALSSLSSTAATTLIKRCFSSTLTRRCAQLPTGSLSSSSLRFTTPPVMKNNNTPYCSNTTQQHTTIRSFSEMPPPPTATSPNAENNGAFQPPTSLMPEAGLGAQDAMKLFIEHGLGKQKLQQIAADKDNNSPLVARWQKMVATYLETQCHVIALLGYRPDEQGITLYTQQLTAALRLSPPDMQEQLRVAGRDTYRMVLAAAFNLPSLIEEQKTNGEMSIVDARNIMHKVSLRMQDPEVLEKVAKQCSVSVAMNDSPEAQQIELARKHTVVQEVMVKDVYLTETEGGVSLVQECGFGEGEDGYIRMQSTLAEHQGDPLINQYVGAAMMKLLQSAGIDMEALRMGQAKA
eukprot:CAMPEP_0201932134 /NCGR_PEP_ID=MMETSP0903-20130614/28827_1 /ASSEMBLY_ACC=CAM_ASM_000552 /TAXON_ID=420261 /ORGANISM="Thalassiosira antarctica, Strain CCMP982" /LENGTH=347 /DNA_ID=CAMNT_0048471659 /DNA_START=29 /DNA_END=1072 /DNA_ORIENTATION=-